MRIFHGQKTSKRPAVNKTALCFEKFEAEGLFVFHIQLDVFFYISGLRKPFSNKGLRAFFESNSITFC